MWGSALNASPVSGVSLNQYLPQSNVSLDDLDVRDAKNNSIKTPASQKEIQEIFQSGLFSLLVETELYSVAGTLSMLERTLGLATQAFGRKLPTLLRSLTTALLPSRKYSTHTSLAVPGLFFGGLAAAFFSITAFLASSFEVRIPTLVLRC
jgi:hypothetical protein